MDYIEEKTTGGITIKVLLKTWEYTAFNKDGSVIYSNDAGGNILHKVPVIAFFGKYLGTVNNTESELVFHKLVKGEIVIPYDDLAHRKRKYLFLKSDEVPDMIPLRIIKITGIYKLVREIENGIFFNHIIIDKSISKNEIVVIKNRCPLSIIIQTGIKDNSPETQNIETGSDYAKADIETDTEKNLNILSNNPVFLAGIHLKNLALSKVNQVLLDFDISSLEAEYMLRFIETMINNKEADEKIEKAKPKLESHADAFRFYICLINKKDDGIRKMINEINDINKISLYSTLVAKVKLLFSKQEDVLLLTEYENLLYEVKDALYNK